MSELLAGHHYWWYNLTIVIYAFAMFGLILAVAEGVRAARNVYNYGLYPGGKELPELIEYDPYSDDSEASGEFERAISDAVDEENPEGLSE
ncbi:MAG: hypothetical protein EAX95_14690 [Candidatus Thorarchaeota archaeon]|nr:hypothetical protein [Candidatus Thorarchaeota archaeon]